MTVPDMQQPGSRAAEVVAQRLLRERIVFLGTEVTDEVASRITGELLLLAAEDPEREITFYVNSPGGSTTAALAIYDTMQLVEPEVATWGIGLCASMGQFLLSSGTPGKRQLLPNARVLVRQPMDELGGTSSDIVKRADLLRDLKRRIADITAEQTGLTVEQITEGGDRYFTAQEALEHGLVDQIVSRLPGPKPPAIQ